MTPSEATKAMICHRKRPRRSKAMRAIRDFLAEIGHDPHPLDIELVEDGHDGWAFWLMEDDTTSYVHHDLKIEWLGTTRDPDRQDEEDDDDAGRQGVRDVQALGGA